MMIRRLILEEEVCGAPDDAPPQRSILAHWASALAEIARFPVLAWPVLLTIYLAAMVGTFVLLAALSSVLIVARGVWRGLRRLTSRQPARGFRGGP
jgi:hypothetical protein